MLQILGPSRYANVSFTYPYQECPNTRRLLITSCHPVLFELLRVSAHFRDTEWAKIRAVISLCALFCTSTLSRESAIGLKRSRHSVWSKGRQSAQRELGA